jgi:phage tail protein X
MIIGADARPHWQEQPARETDGCAMAMIAPNHGLTGKQLAALNLLGPNGCTEAAMKANGLGIGLLATPLRAGLAVATPGVVQAGGRMLGVVRLAITEVGRATVGA